MSDSKLERQIRDYYESQKLPAETLDRLKERIAQARGQADGRRKVGRRWLAIAAALVAALAFVLLTRPHDPERRLRVAIAQEAARDHNLRLDVEVSSRTFAELRSRMSNLNFNPVEPESLKSMPMRLLGGRYASLQGTPAVQIKLADQHGEICTLIQARPIDSLAQVDELSQHQFDGLHIDVWREKGLVMVLIRPIA